MKCDICQKDCCVPSHILTVSNLGYTEVSARICGKCAKELIEKVRKA